MYVEIKHKRIQYKRDINIHGSPNMGYVHRETIIHSFISSKKMKG
jgi:hypothetical protein